jgi:hypothetical protein
MMTFKQRLTASAVAAALGFAGSAFAMTKAEMKTEEDRIAAGFKSEKAKCDDLKANAKDICLAEAKGQNAVAKAEFEQHKKDTAKARYNVRIAKADADYGVAKEKCDDLSGNPKDVCVKDAKAALTGAKADAKVDLESGKARSAANEKIVTARTDAAEDKRDANYAAAKERCDKFSGDVKDRCIIDAKARFNIK